MSVTMRSSVHPLVDRAVAGCIRCAVDRYWNIGTTHVHDPCADACAAAATALLTAERHDPATTVSALTRCAQACEVVGDEAAAIPSQEYAQCAQKCRQIADDLHRASAR